MVRNAPADVAASEGGLIDGRYQLGPQLGRGSSATVHAATDTLLQRPVTVKLFDPIGSGDADLRERFNRQVTKAAGLAHPHIATILDAGVVHGHDGRDRPFVVTEPAGPANLRALLDRERRLPAARAVSIARQVASALSFAHECGVVHADVKPENVLLNATGDDVKLVDFSLSFVSALTGVMTPKTIARRAAYVAPEQVRGEPIGPATDVYALGVLLYEMLVGRPPFVGPTPLATAERRVREHANPAGNYDPSVPPALEAAIGRALDRAPERRWPTIQAFDAELGAVDPRPVRLVLPAPRPPAEQTPGLIQMLGVALRAPLLAAAGIGLLVVALAWLQPMLFGSGPHLSALVQPPPAVPDVVGMNVSDAQELLRARGLDVHVVGERVSDRFARGAIILQTPVAGWTRGVEGPVRVTVSAGPIAPGPLGTPAAAPASADAAVGPCMPGSPRFVQGFAELKRQVGAAMGDPLQCEHTDSTSGDIVQESSTGLAYYRRGTNVAAFTDGWRHWAVTARGLVTWEGASPDAPAG